VDRWVIPQRRELQLEEEGEGEEALQKNQRTLTLRMMKRITERLSSWPFFLGVFLLFELSLTCGCRDRESASVGVYGFGLAGCC
jgi:hypothetical protein